ncbi:MAG: hypothetical protein GF403_09110 [Candidatus Coatesbacteria bacterium]|nr:hypothetical protein [Candidatus Coatesbacteria bacterium]
MSYLEVGITCPYCQMLTQPTIKHRSTIPLALDGVVREKGDCMLFTVAQCPNCANLLYFAVKGFYKKVRGRRGGETGGLNNQRLIYPSYMQLQLDHRVPPAFARAAKEAYTCLDISPTASALLSVRLLRRVLRTFFTKESSERNREERVTLSDDIDHFLIHYSGARILKRSLEKIREFGSLAALSNTGGLPEDLEVCREEARFIIEFIVNELFSFAFILPRKQQEMEAMLNRAARNYEFVE